MDSAGIKQAVEKGSIEWKRHALERMMERGITRSTVKTVLISGEIIGDYPDDGPYPSALFLGYSAGIPFHIVAAFDGAGKRCYVISAYVPDSDHFEDNHKTRRTHEDQGNPGKVSTVRWHQT
jgi:hypothetical protein